jgi:hypothetical protein
VRDTSGDAHVLTGARDDARTGDVERSAARENLEVLLLVEVDRGGNGQLAAAIGAAANGASIEALIYGEREGTTTFDLLIGSILNR